MTTNPPTYAELAEQLAKLAELIDTNNANLRWCIDTIKKDYGITDEEVNGEKSN